MRTLEEILEAKNGKKPLPKNPRCEVKPKYKKYFAKRRKAKEN